MVACDDGIRFRAQDQFQISELLAIETGLFDGLDQPHAIYASGNTDANIVNKNVRVDGVLSINHRMDASFKFKNGINTVTNMRAQHTAMMLRCEKGASGSWRNLDLLD